MGRLREEWLARFHGALLAQLGRSVHVSTSGLRFGRYLVQIRNTAADESVVSGVAMEEPSAIGSSTDAFNFHYHLTDDPEASAEEVVRWLGSRPS